MGLSFLDGEVTTPDYGVGIQGPVLLQLWESSTPDEGARQVVELARRLGRSAEPRTATLVLVAEGSRLPSSTARATLAEVPEALARGAAIAVVREGSGFRSAAIRAVLTGMMMLARRSMPQEVFGELGAAASWIAGRMDGRTSAEELARAMTELRERVRAKR